MEEVDQWLAARVEDEFAHADLVVAGGGDSRAGAAGLGRVSPGGKLEFRLLVRSLEIRRTSECGARASAVPW
eukprot:744103-Lingulodinium_polyedra.AAC.1